MKNLLLLLAIVVGFTALPAQSLAKDRRDDDKSSKDLRNGLAYLQQNYGIMRDRVDHGYGDRRNAEQLRQVGATINNINGLLSSGNYDPRDIRGRIQQANDDLTRIGYDIEHSTKRKGGYYRPQY